MVLTRTQSLTRGLIEPLWTLRFEDLSEADLATTRGLLLDHLGVAASGAQTDTAAAFRRYLADVARSDGPRLPMIGTVESTAAIEAAMANGLAGHCIEYDDTHSGGSLHPAVVIFPAAMAACAVAGADERAFLRAAVIGYEVMCRLGRAANPPGQYRRYFHPTGTCGVFGAAATAASIFGLDADRAVSALGIAGSMAAGSMQFLEDGAWTKRFHPALAARNGLEAAMMARRGFKGPEDAIGGAQGFFGSYSDDPRPELLLAGLGEASFEIHNTSIKAHTCCRYNQGPIDGLLEIRRREGLRPEQVERVRVGFMGPAISIVAEPAEAKRRPTSVVDAQFSMAFAAAVALAEGRAALNQYHESRFTDPAIVGLMDRFEYVHDPELDRAYPEQWRAWVQVISTDGRTLEARVDAPKGDPDNPFTPTELRAKFADLTASIYSPERREAIFAANDGLAEPGGLARLQALLLRDCG